MKTMSAQIRFALGSAVLVAASLARIPASSAAVTFQVTGTELAVTMSAPPNGPFLAVSCPLPSDDMVYVADFPSGIPQATGLACSQATSIQVTGSEASDHIVIGGSFPALASLTVHSGDGDDLVESGVAPSSSLVDLGPGGDRLWDLTGGRTLDIRGGDGVDTYAKGGDPNSVGTDADDLVGPATLADDSLDTPDGPQSLDSIEEVELRVRRPAETNASIDASGFTGATWIVAHGRGATTIVGGPGPSRLEGGLGNDVISGGGGNDLLSGGGGNDEIAGGPGTDRVYEFFPGHAASWIEVTLRDESIQSRVGAVSLSGVERASLGTGGAGIIDASAASIPTVLWESSSYIVKNTLIGGSGPDVLNGGAGPDRLVGNGGRDKLDGGFGLDKCFGTSGQDEFVNCTFIRSDSA